MGNILQYAIKDNKFVHISEVQQGLNCGCICPSCGCRLVSKKGAYNIFHFAHYNAEECNGYLETSLHLLAKEILLEEMKMKLPAVYVNFPDSYKKSELLYNEKTIKFDKVYLENKIDEIIPDITLVFKGTKLLVEIYVTHGVDKSKVEKIKKLGISTLVIDLSDRDYIITKDELKNIIINETKNKRWIYNNKEEEIYCRFKQKARKFEKAEKGDWDFCPQYLYGWKGVSSARWEDCVECEYCFSLVGEDNCLGFTGVSKIKDLDNPKLEEIANELRRKNKIKPEWLQSTQCKKCRQGYMVLRNGKHGDFLGCSNYPTCKHTIKL